MKPRRWIVGSLMLLPVVAAVCCWGLKGRSTSSERVSAEFEAPQFHQPVGWAFGRMIGAPQPTYISPPLPVPPHESGQHSPTR